MPAKDELLADGTFRTKQPVKLPAVLDALIVGGGPAGTACAFHAKELGLHTLVIDFDDIMRRIRDYSKEKEILPDYGRGDKLHFPAAGKLIDNLVFEPIDKDELCQRWKKMYYEHSVPAQIGVEFLGLEKQAGGVWQAQCFNHKLKKKCRYRAKHIVIAIGRGEPRTFDLPGNCEGIAYRLDDPAKYVGQPALVIGGGTSAAEAVLAISDHKHRHNDPTAVYWSYRGQKMPKVSKALSDRFFKAYVYNGNIRYFPESEAAAIVTAEDKNEYLAIRVDRKRIAGRPNETIQLEFPKQSCVACIGEDVPEKLLSQLGIHMRTGGPKSKKRMVVNRYLETEQPNVFLIGETLSDVYLEADDFNGDPAFFQEIKHRGNIKTSLRSGVYVAKVIAEKLKGMRDIRVIVEDHIEKTSDTEPGAAPPVPVTSSEADACITHLLSENVEGEAFRISPDAVTTIGRERCDLTFANDELMSTHHASIVHRADGYFLRDDGSTNGVLLRIPAGETRNVAEGAEIHAGEQFVCILQKNGHFHLKHFNSNGQEINRIPVAEKMKIFGRETADAVLEPEDLTLSRRHIGVAVRDDSIQVKDLGSRNGTFVRINESTDLQHNDEFRIGQQRFRFTIKSLLSPVQELGRTSSARLPESDTIIEEQRALAEPPKQGERIVTFTGTGEKCPFRAGQSICEIAKENGIALQTDCLQGNCGSDPIRILSGKEFFNEISTREADTLEDICDLEPGNYRLACVARPAGPVEVEILE